MTRIVKEAAVRRREILDTALELFADHGFDGTSVNRIIEAIGISKGAFYHHFRSKDDILTAVAADLAEAAVTAILPVVDDPEATALEKLRAFFGGAAQSKRDAVGDALLMKLAKALYAPANLRLRVALEDASVARSSPLLTRIIEAGVARGELDPVAEPAVTAELVLQMGTAAARAGAGTDVDLVMKKLAAHKRAVARLLGLDADSLEV